MCTVNQLGFQILESVSTHDHETRILIDGEDWLSKDTLGIDPSSFFAQEAIGKEGHLLVGRCDCGYEGCCDTWIQVSRDGGSVYWTDEQGLHLRFHAEQYDSMIKQVTSDFSWETVERTAERIVNSVLKEAYIDGGFLFEWASARVKSGVITLSFVLGDTQRLEEIIWDGRGLDTAYANATQFRSSREVKLE